MAWMVRRAGPPGGPLAAGLIGGAIAGVLLGATVLGHAAPALHERLFQGGGVERAALVAKEREQEAAVAALRAVDASPVAVTELRARQRVDLAPLQEAYRAARETTLAMLLLGAMALHFLLLVTGAWRIVGRARREPGSTRAALLAGAAFCIVGGVPAALLARWTLRVGWPAAAAFGVAMAIGGFPGLRSRRVGAPGRGRATDVASITALLAGAFAAGVLARSWLVGVVVLGAPLGLVGRMVRPPRAMTVRRLRSLTNGVIAPGLAAYAAARVDFSALASAREFWIAVVIGVILASDGRWLGGWLGWWTAGATRGVRDEAWRRSAAMVNAGVGALQVGAALSLYGTGLLDQAMLGAVLVAAIVLEVTAGARRHVGVWLDRAGG